MSQGSPRTWQPRRGCCSGPSRSQTAMWGYDVITSQPPGGTGDYLMPSFINTGTKTPKNLWGFLQYTVHSFVPVCVGRLCLHPFLGLSSSLSQARHGRHDPCVGANQPLEFGARVFSSWAAGSGPTLGPRGWDLVDARWLESFSHLLRSEA